MRRTLVVAERFLGIVFRSNHTPVIVSFIRWTPFQQFGWKKTARFWIAAILIGPAVAVFAGPHHLPHGLLTSCRHNIGWVDFFHFASSSRKLNIFCLYLSFTILISLSQNERCSKMPSGDLISTWTYWKSGRLVVNILIACRSIQTVNRHRRLTQHQQPQ